MILRLERSAALAIIAILSISLVLSTYALGESRETSQCVLVITDRYYRLLCVSSGKFFGSYEELVAPATKSLDVLYRGASPHVSGVVAITINTTLAQGAIVVSIKSIVGNNDSIVSEHVKSIIMATDKRMYIEYFEYAISFPLINATMGKNVSVDMSRDLARVLRNVKYVDNVGEASLTIETHQGMVSARVVARGMVIDSVVYQAIKGLSGVCRYLPSTIGSLSASIALTSSKAVATLRVEGNVSRIMLSLACLTPLALDLGSKVLQSRSFGSVGEVLSEIAYISSLSSMGSTIPSLIKGFVKPLIVEYEGIEALGLAGIGIQVFGNGSSIALNMTAWPLSVSRNATYVRKVIEEAYRLAFSKAPLNALASAFQPSKAKIYLKGLTSVTSIPLRRSFGLRELMYVLIAIVAVQAAIVTLILWKLVRKR